jgi:hypothetical protein
MSSPAPAESPARSRAPRQFPPTARSSCSGRPVAAGSAPGNGTCSPRPVLERSSGSWCSTRPASALVLLPSEGRWYQGVSVAPDLPAAAELGGSVMSDWPEPVIRPEDSQQAPAESKEEWKEESKEGSKEPTEPTATSPCPRRRDRSQPVALVSTTRSARRSPMGRPQPKVAPMRRASSRRSSSRQRWPPAPRSTESPRPPVPIRPRTAPRRS